MIHVEQVVGVDIFCWLKIGWARVNSIFLSRLSSLVMQLLCGGCIDINSMPIDITPCCFDVFSMLVDIGWM